MKSYNYFIGILVSSFLTMFFSLSCTPKPERVVKREIHETYPYLKYFDLEEKGASERLELDKEKAYKIHIVTHDKKEFAGIFGVNFDLSKKSIISKRSKIEYLGKQKYYYSFYYREDKRHNIVHSSSLYNKNELIDISKEIAYTSMFLSKEITIPFVTNEFDDLIYARTIVHPGKDSLEINIVEYNPELINQRRIEKRKEYEEQRKAPYSLDEMIGVWEFILGAAVVLYEHDDDYWLVTIEKNGVYGTPVRQIRFTYKGRTAYRDYDYPEEAKVIMSNGDLNCYDSGELAATYKKRWLKE